MTDFILTELHSHLPNWDMMRKSSCNSAYAYAFSGSQAAAWFLIFRASSSALFLSLFCNKLALKGYGTFFFWSVKRQLQGPSTNPPLYICRSWAKFNAFQSWVKKATEVLQERRVRFTWRHGNDFLMVTITSTHSLPDWKHTKALFCKSLSPKQEEDQLKEWLQLN